MLILTSLSTKIRSHFCQPFLRMLNLIVNTQARPYSHQAFLHAVEAHLNLPIL
jgi:hypothetical protein